MNCEFAISRKTFSEISAARVFVQFRTESSRRQVARKDRNSSKYTRENSLTVDPIPYLPNRIDRIKITEKKGL